MSHKDHTHRRKIGLATAFLTIAMVTLSTTPSFAAEVELIPMRQIGGPGHAGLYGWGAATAPDGSVYISDYWNFRIQHFAKDGSLLGTVVPKVTSGPNAHAAPYGIGVDPRNGDIYFGDVDSNATVDKYSASGQFLFQFGGLGTGLGKFNYPSRIAVTPDGTVIVSDSRAEKIVVLDDSGNFLFEKLGVQTGTTVLKRPRGIAVDDQGLVYIADAGLQQVQVFSLNAAKTALTFVRSMGTPKAAPGEPLPGEIGRDLRGLAIDQDTDSLYVVDADTKHIVKFRMSDGQFIKFFASEGTDDGEFSGGGRDITVDGDGNLWVGDMPNFRAQKFDPNGNFLQKVPDPPQPPPQGGFAQPFSVAVDPAGNIFVTDTYNWRIQKFSPSGQFLLQWGSRGVGNYQFNYARGIAIDPFTSNVIVADSDGNAIKMYDNNGVFLCSIDKYGDGNSEFKGPMAVDIGPDGAIYVADTQNGRVQILETSPAPGGCTMELRAVNGVLGGKGTADGKFQATNGIAVDTDGTIWVADRLQGRVTHLSNSGAFLGKFGTGVGTAPTQFARARDVEVDANYVYVSDTDANKIKVWRKDGTFVREIGSTGGNLGQYQRPQGMDLVDGRLFIAEQTNERVQELAVGINLNPESVRPNGEITVPAANQTFPNVANTFSGTATDDTGVSTVQVSVKNVATGLYWTGFSWGLFTWLPTTPSANGVGAKSITWSFTLPQPGAGSYGLQARAMDVWGNVDSTVPFRNFSVYAGAPDPTAPTGAITTPVANQLFPAGPVTFSGMGADNAGVTGAQVAIKNTSTNQWWSGSGWGATFTWLSATVASPGATSTTWSYGWTPPQAGNFGMQARVKDAAGNYGNMPFVVFRVA